MDSNSKRGAGLWKQDALFLAALFGLAAAMVYGRLDDAGDAKITAAHVKEAQEKKADVKPEDRVALSLPLSCDFTATHSGPQGIDRTRCYQRSGK